MTAGPAHPALEGACSSASRGLAQRTPSPHRAARSASPRAAERPGHFSGYGPYLPLVVASPDSATLFKVSGPPCSVSPGKPPWPRACARSSGLGRRGLSRGCDEVWTQRASLWPAISQVRWFSPPNKQIGLCLCASRGRSEEDRASPLSTAERGALTHVAPRGVFLTVTVLVELLRVAGWAGFAPGEAAETMLGSSQIVDVGC